MSAQTAPTVQPARTSVGQWTLRTSSRPLALPHRLDGADGIYVRVGGEWRYMYRAVDGTSQTIDFLLSAKRDKKAAKCSFRQVLDRENTRNLLYRRGSAQELPWRAPRDEAGRRAVALRAAQRSFVHQVFGLAA